MFQSGLQAGLFDDSEMNYRAWVTRSKSRSSSLRKTLALRRSASESTSCVLWQMAAAHTFSTRRQVGASDREDLLPAQAMNWPTATGADSKREITSETHPSFPMAATNWPAPAARDHKGGGKARLRGDGKSRLDMLDWKAESFPCSHPAPAETMERWPDLYAALAERNTPESSLELLRIIDAGLSSLLEVWTPPSCRRMGADFQHWLMGWPSPVRTCFDSGAMELYRSRLLWHLSRLCGGCNVF